MGNVNNEPISEPHRSVRYYGHHSKKITLVQPEHQK